MGIVVTFFVKLGDQAWAGRIADVASTFETILPPDKKLRRGAAYTASVTTAARDAAGSAVVAKSWKFRIEP